MLRWLESPGIRLVDVDGDWVCRSPNGPAPRALRRGQPVRLSLTPFDEQRLPSPVHRPARADPRRTPLVEEGAPRGPRWSERSAPRPSRGPSVSPMLNADSRSWRE